MKNQLHTSYSPYLLQHADNPVFWKIWNEKNLLKTKTENKLMIISIGYAACHWCHVMEKECFEDKETANIMNQHFYSFKIDREELPTIDAYYMHALQIMTKQGGWPLNIVALPNGLPVWGATYMPKQKWMDVLQQLAALFNSDPDKMYEYAESLNKGILLANDTLEIYPKNSSKLSLEPLIDQWKKSFDSVFGGYQRAPKFMMPTNLNFLSYYGQIHQDKDLTNHVNLTLTKMAYGGLFDVIEGGFSRYSVDHEWHIPHFEKMLYDNAQLLSTYSLAYINSENKLFKEVVNKTVSFLLNNWQDTSGGFYSAYDADSLNDHKKLEEGAYYFWKGKELKELIHPTEWKLFSEVFSIAKEYIWEEAEAYVLFQRNELTTIAERNLIEVTTLKFLKDKWEATLLEKRSERIKPLLDDKILISWNAQLLSGFIDAQKIIDSSNLNEAISKLASFLMNTAYHENILGRAYKNNRIYIDGSLEDYAFTIKAFIELFNSSQNIHYLKFAQTLTFQAIDLFFDSEQGFFKSSLDKSIGTIFEIEDNVIPSANAIMSSNLFYIGHLFKNDHLIHIAKEMTKRVLNQINYASAFSEWLVNDLVFTNEFEYIVVKKIKIEELNILNQNSHRRIILDNSLNIPILAAYANQDKKFQICNATSCKIQTDDINEILK